MNDELTDKQRLFISEYLVDQNATAAAKRAGYSADSARYIGAENLTKPHIRAAIADALDARAKAIGMNAKRVLARLVEQHEADLADIHDEEGRLLPIEDWPPVWRRGLVAGVETEEMYEVQVNLETGKRERVFTGIKRKLKLADRQKVTDLIGKHVDVQAWREQVAHDATTPMKEFLGRISGRSIRPTDDGSGNAKP